jgi:hypothetical protein
LAPPRRPGARPAPQQTVVKAQQHSAGDASPLTALLLPQIFPIIPDILGRRALSAGRLGALGATPDFHHGLQGETVVLGNQVRDAERAFARSMADRDHAAFVSFLSDEAVFMSEAHTLRGKRAIGEGWKRFYDGAQRRSRGNPNASKCSTRARWR